MAMLKIEVLKSAVPGEGRKLPVPPEGYIEGDPVLTSWEIDNLKDGALRAGLWEATPGTIRVVKGETWEFCTILSGRAEITGEDGEVIHVKAGDTLVMRPGFVGAWKTLETMRKYWVIAK
jgi:uncharacterized cupin superfamily protein